MRRSALIPTLGLALGLASASLPASAAEVATSAEDIHPLLIGAQMPAITMQDLDGKAVDLNKVVADKPAVLIFYRGGW